MWRGHPSLRKNNCAVRTMAEWQMTRTIPDPKTRSQRPLWIINPIKITHFCGMIFHKAWERAALRPMLNCY